MSAGRNSTSPHAAVPTRAGHRLRQPRCGTAAAASRRPQHRPRTPDGIASIRAARTSTVTWTQESRANRDTIAALHAQARPLDRDRQQPPVTAPTSRSGRSHRARVLPYRPRRLVLPLPHRFHILLTRPSAAEPIGAFGPRAGLFASPCSLILRVAHRPFFSVTASSIRSTALLHGTAPRASRCAAISHAPIAPSLRRPPSLVFSRRAWPISVTFPPPFTVFYTPRVDAHGPGRTGCEPTTTQTRRRNSMIELYGMGSPNVVKIYIALEELDLPTRSIRSTCSAASSSTPPS